MHLGNIVSDFLERASRLLMVAIFGGLMIVIVSMFAYAAFQVLYTALIALDSPWWIWGMFVLAFGSMLVKEAKEVVALGFLGSIFAGYLAYTISDWSALIVIVGTWIPFGAYKYLTRDS